jgi:hypothetical protein
MITLRDQITEKLKEVPEYRLREVLDFLDFLTWKQNNNGRGKPVVKENPLLSVLGILEGEPVTNEQIDVALYGPSFAKEEAGGE